MGPKLPPLNVTAAEWELIVDTCREHIHPRLPAAHCFTRYSVCPAGIITPLSWELYRLYNACRGYSRISKPSEYYDLPAIYIEACDVISREENMLRPKNG